MPIVRRCARYNQDAPASRGHPGRSTQWTSDLPSPADCARGALQIADANLQFQHNMK